MSNKKYAFIDEFGAFGYDFDNQGCTTHFLIGAVIVDESNLSFVSERVENIRKKYSYLISLPQLGQNLVNSSILETQFEQ